MKVRRKSPILEAVQWTPGLVMDGLTDMPVEVVKSRCGNWFYINGHGERADRWLPTDEANAEHSLHFAFYEVKVGLRQPISPDDPLVKRYGAACGWTSAPQPYAVFRDAKGRTTIVSLGHWIIGGERVASSDELAADYDVVESA